MWIYNPILSIFLLKLREDLFEQLFHIKYNI
jgi:hypothetical protein